MVLICPSLCRRIVAPSRYRNQPLSEWSVLRPSIVHDVGRHGIFLLLRGSSNGVCGIHFSGSTPVHAACRNPDSHHRPQIPCASSPKLPPTPRQHHRRLQLILARRRTCAHRPRSRTPQNPASPQVSPPALRPLCFSITHRPVIHRMPDRRRREHNPVQQRHAKAERRAARQRLHQPARRRTMQEKLVAHAHVIRRHHKRTPPTTNPTWQTNASSRMR